MKKLKCKLGKYKQGSGFAYFTFEHQGKTYERKASVGLLARLKDKDLLYSNSDFIVEVDNLDYKVRKVTMLDNDPKLVSEYTNLLSTLKTSLNEEQYNILKEEFLKELYDKGN